MHFLPGDRDIAAMPVDQWMGPAAVVDLTHLGENGEVTADDLERRAGHVEAGDIVLLRTDWPRQVPGGERALLAAMRPGPGASACEWLVARGVKAVGYDYPPDYCIRTSIFSPGTQVTRDECTTHDVFFPAGHHGDRVPDQPRSDRRAALPLHRAAAAIDGADGSPVRAIALVD